MAFSEVCSVLCVLGVCSASTKFHRQQVFQNNLFIQTSNMVSKATKDRKKLRVRQFRVETVAGWGSS